MTTYRFEQNKHRTNQYKICLFYDITKLSKKIVFNKSCYYNWVNKDSDDINKLYGFSNGYHKHNSVRFGWVPNFNKNLIKIYGYIYNNKKRHFKFITEVELDKIINTEIILDKNNKKAIFIVNESSIKLNYNPNCKLSYMLYPYFGGNNKTPHKMEILFI
jgi:hypothetical protein